MKKFLALILALVMALALVACGGNSNNNTTPDNNTTPPAENTENTENTEPAENTENTETPAITSKVAMVTDYGDITDQSFNQTTYEACKKFCDDNNVDFTYYKPAGDTTADRVAKFIALDVAEGDLLEAGVTAKGEQYDYNPANWNFADYVDMSNVYCAVYQEELCGYMAGYAAVALGYKNLGFLGGMAVPAVQRYGYGFVQGADAAAAKLNASDIKLNYVYGGQFFGDADITASMDTWYSNGTEIVFACGGGIFTSAVDAAKKVDGKVIGVDVDQAGVIQGYAGASDTSMTVTSAMKGLYPTTYDTLKDVLVNGNWANYAGKVATLGLVSGTDPEANYVQIPMGSTQWSDGFTQDDYKALVAGMFDGSIKVSNDISKSAADFATVITVNDQGQIKG